MATAEGGSVPTAEWGKVWERFPRQPIRVWGSVVSSASVIRRRAPAENGVF